MGLKMHKVPFSAAVSSGGKRAMWLALVCAAARGEREKPECQMTCWGGDRAEVRPCKAYKTTKRKKN